MLPGKADSKNPTSRHFLHVNADVQLKCISRRENLLETEKQVEKFCPVKTY